ncbi:hypothetical protein CLNEO_24030 [Anaerotignum neopropionicum]|uniref:DUF5720 domain-containing protein n=2 Tax=Anaerotignum neopropionicum TaxID=36847 RepID=A0A136WCI9_9FIRM|nr:hypothetical protein CLNEO_24030 [Anaerotignum neopropionicum]
MALERFGEDTRHMIVEASSPVDFKGERMRLFLADNGYQKVLESKKRDEIKVKRHAKVLNEYLFYDKLKQEIR